VNEAAAAPRAPIYTIGHSTRELPELIEALRGFGVTTLVDVRTIPRSRHCPQFDREPFAQALREAGIGYRHAKGLGGLRKPRRDSANGAWRNDSFRGFADYMQTEAFAEALAELEREGDGGPVAIMCAEAVPWRCHRSLIADALAARGRPVIHIMAPGVARPHRLTPWARVEGLRVTYPPQAGFNRLTRRAAKG
jgi:uncharacterized protein (DUF488 family)